MSPYLPVSPSRVLRAPDTSPYHTVRKHLRTTCSRPEQSHLLPEAFRRSVMRILNLSESLAKPLFMAKLNIAYLSSWKNQWNFCIAFVPPALHRPVCCRSTFGSRGPGLSNLTSFLRPALPMAPTRDDNATDKRSVLRPNPAIFSRDFSLYITTNYHFIWKSCTNRGWKGYTKKWNSCMVSYLRIFAPCAALWWF